MLDLSGIPKDGISIEKYRELIQSKAKAICETLKGVTYEQSKGIIEVVSDEIERRISKTTL
jgi:hypothetical protein